MKKENLKWLFTRGIEKKIEMLLSHRATINDVVDEFYNSMIKMSNVRKMEFLQALNLKAYKNGSRNYFMTEIDTIIYSISLNGDDHKIEFKLKNNYGNIEESEYDLAQKFNNGDKVVVIKLSDFEEVMSKIKSDEELKKYLDK